MWNLAGHPLIMRGIPTVAKDPCITLIPTFHNIPPDLHASSRSQRANYSSFSGYFTSTFGDGPPSPNRQNTVSLDQHGPSAPSHATSTPADDWSTLAQFAPPNKSRVFARVEETLHHRVTISTVLFPHRQTASVKISRLLTAVHHIT